MYSFAHDWRQPAVIDSSTVPTASHEALASVLGRAVTLPVAADLEASLSDKWPLGALQLAFVPEQVCPPSGLHTAAGLAILSVKHLVKPQALEQVRISPRLPWHTARAADWTSTDMGSCAAMRFWHS